MNDLMTQIKSKYSAEFEGCNTILHASTQHKNCASSELVQGESYVFAQCELGTNDVSLDEEHLLTTLGPTQRAKSRSANSCLKTDDFTHSLVDKSSFGKTAPTQQARPTMIEKFSVSRGDDTVALSHYSHSPYAEQTLHKRACKFEHLSCLGSVVEQS